MMGNIWNDSIMGALPFLILTLLMYPLGQEYYRDFWESQQESQYESMIVRWNSMEPIFHNGESLLVDRSAYTRYSPRRSERVIISFAGHPFPIVKTISGVPGDTFSLTVDENRNSTLVINDMIAKNSLWNAYILSTHESALWESYAREMHGIIPPDSYIILWEVPTGSLDSRRFWFIRGEDILWKVREK